ncbi:MAG TPA: glycosyltransferase family 9 protein [Capsulimonadaceae bacterium]|nr:glycosyltransferase family 9 protein [Capsulimonadaceae bacterium]
MKKILIIKMWAIGDILMATPILNAIRAAEPDAHIAWLVDIMHAEVLANHPLIDEVIALDSGSWRRLRRKGKLISWARRTKEIRKDLRARGFDSAINCQAQEWWSWFLAVAPARMGLFSWPKMPATRRLYTRAIPKPRLAGLHNTDHFLQATSALGYAPASKRMTIGETAEEKPFAADFWRSHGLDEGRLTVALAPFSTAQNRSLPTDLAARMADWLGEEYGAQIIVTCGPKEIDQARELAADCIKARMVVAEGTTLRQYIGLLRRSDLVIAGDSSPMHLAAALDVPYVALFGPTPADERAPLEGRGVVLKKPLPCAPCDLPTCSNAVFQQCMKLIELRDVQEAVRSLVGQASVKGIASPR